MASSIDFKNYSKEYDNLLKYSTPYIELLDSLKILIAKYTSNKSDVSVLDVGAGTGNISKLIEDSVAPKQIKRMVLVEPSTEMLAFARTKLKGQNIDYLPINFEDFQTTNKYDFIVCIHALYLMDDPESLIERFSKYMHEDSVLVICDIGSEIKISKWTRHLLYANMKKYGVIKGIRILLANKEIKNANKDIAIKQKRGEIWKHSLEEFAQKFSTYYNILEKSNTFFGCSNLLICKKKT